MDLLELALKGSSCDKTNLDLKQVLESIDSGSEVPGHTTDGITVDEMKEAQEKLSKVVTPEQTQHAMTILSGFRVGATEEDTEAAVVSFNA